MSHLVCRGWNEYQSSFLSEDSKCTSHELIQNQLSSGNLPLSCDHVPSSEDFLKSSPKPKLALAKLANFLTLIFKNSWIKKKISPQTQWEICIDAQSSPNRNHETLLEVLGNPNYSQHGISHGEDICVHEDRFVSSERKSFCNSYMPSFRPQGIFKGESSNFVGIFLFGVKLS